METLDFLLTAAAIRERCRDLYHRGLAGELAYFSVHPERLDACAAYVVETTLSRYPDLQIPFHSRWRHFELGGRNLWREFLGRPSDKTPLDMIRTALDLVVVSVLLDAGAGDRWRYRDEQGAGTWSRSEGLALASLRVFAAGGFSSRGREPRRADARALLELTPTALGRGLQVSRDNPLTGLHSRVELLNRLGRMLLDRYTTTERSNPRVSAVFEPFLVNATHRTIRARDVLETIVAAFAEIWPSGMVVAGRPLGDVGYHGLAPGAGVSQGLVPFHKLPQWLCYSALEPLMWAGAEVSGLGDLTGLPEYRNGGLLIDTGVLQPAAGVLRDAWPVASEPVVEWRALTVCLLDEIARRMRGQLSLDSEQLPLAKVLQGGTWAAGRRIAAETRPGGASPIRLEADGTVF